MVLTQNKSTLHYTDSNAKARDTKDLNEVTCRHKDQRGKDLNLNNPIIEDDESEENSFDDLEYDHQDTPKDDHQDMPTNGGTKKKGQSTRFRPHGHYCQEVTND
uniref:Uncharacterized protein n=1 Tax=Cannabis sativa TaxID=3483 RepID=A0A803NQZ5_CANSA